MTATSPSVTTMPVSLTHRNFEPKDLHVVPDESAGDMRTFTVSYLPGLAPGLTTAGVLAEMENLRNMLKAAGLELEGTPWMSLVSANSSHLRVTLRGSVDARERLLHVVTAILRVWYTQAPDSFFRSSIPDTV